MIKTLFLRRYGSGAREVASGEVTEMKGTPPPIFVKEIDSKGVGGDITKEIDSVVFMETTIFSGVVGRQE